MVLQGNQGKLVVVFKGLAVSVVQFQFVVFVWKKSFEVVVEA